MLSPCASTMPACADWHLHVCSFDLPFCCLRAFFYLWGFQSLLVHVAHLQLFVGYNSNCLLWGCCDILFCSRPQLSQLFDWAFIISGWWFEPLWKNISQLGWLFPIYGKIKLMFQTTNQISLDQPSTQWKSQRLWWSHFHFTLRWSSNRKAQTESTIPMWSSCHDEAKTPQSYYHHIFWVCIQFLSKYQCLRLI